MAAQNLNEILALMKSAQASPDDGIAKNFTQPGSATVGLQYYNLQAPALNLFPVMTPLRNMTPRIGGGFAIQANWKAFTAINTGNMRAGVSEGARAGVIGQTLAEYFAAFRGYGLENNVTFEAQYAGQGYDDVKARSVTQLLQAMMIQEERLLLGGNTSMALGTTPSPTVSANTTGGALPASTYSVIAVALTNQAYQDMVGVNNGAIGQSLVLSNATVPAQITRTNADGTTTSYGGGAAQKSTNTTVTTTGATSSVTASVAPVRGAAGYAWFFGAAGSEVLSAVTSINSVVFTAAVTGTQTAASLTATDSSTSSLDFDGLLTIAANPVYGGYYAAQATGNAGTGTPLTADGAGGIVEIDAALDYFFTKYRISPGRLIVSYQESRNISKKVIANGGAPLLRVTEAANDAGDVLGGGRRVTQYLNKITGQMIEIMVHPNMPAGTMMFETSSLPYPLNGVGNVYQMLMRQDYYQLEWPLRSRRYEFGVYADGVLQHYAPFTLGIISNIANG
jgi:hypothetical protein